MIRKILCMLAFALSCISMHAQQHPNLYKGTIDGKMQVTLFMQSEENGCGADPFYSAMYRYDKVSNWLELDVNVNEKQQYAMVEFGFTGLMILKKEGSVLKGTWISPDGKRQLPVQLKEAPMNSKELESYRSKMEKVNYENHDC